MFARRRSSHKLAYVFIHMHGRHRRTRHSASQDRAGDRLLRASLPLSGVKAKFHYTGQTGPARTLSDTRTDPTEFRGDPGRKKVRAGPVGPV